MKQWEKVYPESTRAVIRHPHGYEQRRGKKTMKRNDFSDRVIKFIITRSNDELGDLTIAKITCILKISRSHLYQQFKNAKKFTPGEYLVMIKMIRSAYMLVEDRALSIEKIAHKMGFSSTDYFIKVFRHQFGTSPGQYRKYARQN